MDLHTKTRKWFRNNGIPLTVAARHTGYTRGHLSDVLNGHSPLSDAVRVRIAEAFPETADFLLAPSLRRSKEVLDE